MNFRKNSKGITLVALVVTIIILLILAGVSIALVSGGNGILGKATKAVDETKRTSAQEELELVWLACSSDYYINYGEKEKKDFFTKDELNNKNSGKGNVIDSLTSDENKKTEINIPGTSHIAYEYNGSEYYFEIDEKGKIILSEGENSSDEKKDEEDSGKESGTVSQPSENESLASKVQPGDYVTYTPDIVSTTGILDELSTYSGNTDSTKNTSSTLTQETELKWRVLDVVDGKVRLISAVPTTSIVALEGYNGYNNAVYLLDKTCKTLYSKTGYSENVQNLKIEDIQKYMTITDYSALDSNYGRTFSPTKLKYPSILVQEVGQTITGIPQSETRLGLSEQTIPINQTAVNTATSWTLTHKKWYKEMVESDFTNPIYYNLLVSNGIQNSYWLSSRYVSAINYYCAEFTVRCVYGSTHAVWGAMPYCSHDLTYNCGNQFRPVITLKSNVLVKSGEGSQTSPYEIGL